MAELERYEHTEHHDARRGASHTLYRRKPSVEVSAPKSKPATIKPATTYRIDVSPTPGRTCAYVAAANREARSQTPPAMAPARAPASAPVMTPSTTNGPRSIHARAPRSRVIVTSSLRAAATPRTELALTAYATTAKINSSVAPRAPITRAIRRSREYMSGSYDVGYDGSTAGSPATPATSLTDRTVTSKLAGKGLDELRLPSESSPGRLCASLSACSALTYVTADTRGSPTSRVSSAVTASEVASGAR